MSPALISKDFARVIETRSRAVPATQAASRENEKELKWVQPLESSLSTVVSVLIFLISSASADDILVSAALAVPVAMVDLRQMTTNVHITRDGEKWGCRRRLQILTQLSFSSDVSWSKHGLLTAGRQVPCAGQQRDSRPGCGQRNGAQCRHRISDSGGRSIHTQVSPRRCTGVVDGFRFEANRFAVLRR